MDETVRRQNAARDRALEAAGAVAGPALRLLGSPGAVARHADDERIRVRLLSRLRWAAIVGQLAVVVPGIQTGWLAPDKLPPYLAIVAGLTAFNVYVGWWLRLRPRRDVRSVLGHMAIDLGALTWLLLLSGGAWNPLAPIFIIHAGLGALLLDGWRSAVLAGLLVLVSVLISVAPILPPAAPAPTTGTFLTMTSNALVAIVVWAMTVWLSQGLSGQRRLLQNLKDHQGRVDRLRAVGALAAGFSHEFSTPLNTLRMRLGRLDRRELDAESQKDIEAAFAACDRCEGVLQSMVGRQLDPTKMRLQATDLLALVRRVTLSWEAEHSSVDLVVDSAPDHLCHLPEVPFAQVLLDLLDNAEEAMAAPQPGDLQLVIACDEDVCRVLVRDRGPGFPEVVRNNLGQPFLTTKAGGNGLGLYNAHSLAVALGGDLHLRGRDGGGAEIALVLPCNHSLSGDTP